MRALAKASAVVATATALAAIGGGIASAGWFVTSARSTATVRTLQMPGFDRGPVVERQPRTDSVSVRWVTRPAQRYIVERYDTATGAGTPVCAVVTGGCQDDDVPAGTWAYTVRAVNWRWTGPESPRSAALTIPPRRRPGTFPASPEPSATTASRIPQPSTSAAGSKAGESKVGESKVGEAETGDSKAGAAKASVSESKVDPRPSGSPSPATDADSSAPAEPGPGDG